MNQSLSDSYDDIPYPSYNYQKTRPDQLAAVGQLFGMEPADFTHARVLELGCASGGNLLPMAAVYPDSTFVGIDLSDKQIDAGRRAIADLNLENIRLERASIMDIEAGFGEFDFIIAHGIYSWVTDDVREKTLAICKDNLAPKGIAYVSYNTLPGWNILKSIRDMMVYHTGDLDNPAAKILEARRMLTFTLENLSGGETPYKNLLKREIDIISGFDDNYLLHDHLEQCNEPCYFHEFMTKASAKGLQYLGDVDVATMYLGNFSRTARDTLAQVTDIIRQEQYLDFLSDRRFRSSLLCHADVELSRNLSVDRLAGFLFTTVLTRKDGFSSVDLSVDGPVVFDYLTTGDTVTSATRAGTAAICALGDSAARPLSVDEVVAKAVALLGDVPGDVVRQTFLEFAGQLLLSGAIEIALDPGFQVTEVSERPEAWSVARHKAVSANYVPNVLHRGVKLGDDARVMLQYVDGTRTVDEIIDAYVPNFFNGNLTYMIDGVAVTNEDKIRGSMAPIVTNGLRVFAASSLLVA